MPSKAFNPTKDYTLTFFDHITPDVKQYVVEPHISIENKSILNKEYFSKYVEKLLGDDSIENNKILYQAVRGNKLLVVKAILESEKFKLNHKDLAALKIQEYDGNRYRILANLIRICVEEDYIDMIALLANSGADLDKDIFDGSRAIHWAVLHDKINSADMLIKLGANTDAVDDEKRTIAHYIAKRKKPALLDLLKKHDIDMSERRHLLGFTPFMIALIENNLDAVKFFLDEKVNLMYPAVLPNEIVSDLNKFFPQDTCDNLTRFIDSSPDLNSNSFLFIITPYAWAVLSNNQEAK